MELLFLIVFWGVVERGLVCKIYCCELVAWKSLRSNFSQSRIFGPHRQSPKRIVRLVGFPPPVVVAGGPGFEPRLSESESEVLPLNYPPRESVFSTSPAGLQLAPSKALALGTRYPDHGKTAPQGSAR